MLKACNNFLTNFVEEKFVDDKFAGENDLI